MCSPSSFDDNTRHMRFPSLHMHSCFNLFHVPTTCAVFLHGRKIVSPSNMTNCIFHSANGQFIDVFRARIQKAIVNEMESNYGKVVCMHFAIFGVHIHGRDSHRLLSLDAHFLSIVSLIELLTHKSLCRYCFSIGFARAQEMNKTKRLARMLHGFAVGFVQSTTIKPNRIRNRCVLDVVYSHINWRLMENQGLEQ